MINLTDLWIANGHVNLYNSLLINSDSKVVVVLNRKVFSTSLAVVFSGAYAEVLAKYNELFSCDGVDAANSYVHSESYDTLNYLTLHDITGVDPVRVLVEDGYLFVFAVRDPIKRLKSYFRRTLLQRLDYGRCDEKYLIGTSPYNYNLVDSFDDFSRRVFTDMKFNQSDPHWMHQSFVNFYNVSDRFVIFTEENFDENMRLTTTAIFGQPRQSIHLNNNSHVIQNLASDFWNVSLEISDAIDNESSLIRLDGKIFSSDLKL